MTESSKTELAEPGIRSYGLAELTVEQAFLQCCQSNP